MTTEFLPVKAAAARVGMSRKTIWRLVNEIVAVETNEAGESTGTTHADRDHLRPSVEELADLKTKGESHKWKISTDLIDRRWGSERPNQKPDAAKKPKPTATQAADVVALLTRQTEQLKAQLEKKDTQLDRKDDQIDGLNHSLQEATEASNKYASIVQKMQDNPLLLVAPPLQKPRDIKNEFVEGSATEKEPSGQKASNGQPSAEPITENPTESDESAGSTNDTSAPTAPDADNESPSETGERKETAPTQPDSTTPTPDEEQDNQSSATPHRGWWSRLLRRA